MYIYFVYDSSIIRHICNSTFCQVSNEICRCVQVCRITMIFFMMLLHLLRFLLNTQAYDEIWKGLWNFAQLEVLLLNGTNVHLTRCDGWSVCRNFLKRQGNYTYIAPLSEYLLLFSPVKAGKVGHQVRNFGQALWKLRWSQIAQVSATSVSGKRKKGRSRLWESSG